MKRIRMIFILAALGTLAGCPTTASGPATHTVHGTITNSDAQGAVGNIVVTVTQGSNSYSVSVPDAGIQSITYSIAGVPDGTYSVSVVYTSASNYSFFIFQYQINGGTPSSIDSAAPTYDQYQHSIYAITLQDFSISTDILLDGSLQGYST